MKKLAKLTALLLTGVMLLLLASCGAAPLTPEQQAKEQILAALNEYRASKGANAVVADPELSKAEQFWVDAFRKEGDYKVLSTKTDPVYKEYKKMLPSDWNYRAFLGWECHTLQDGQDYDILDTTDPSDTVALKRRFLDGKGNFADNSGTAVGIGVMTINGKIYWSCTLYAPAN